MKSGHPALDPLYVSPEGVLSIRKEQLESPQILCTLLHGHRHVKNLFVQINGSRTMYLVLCFDTHKIFKFLYLTSQFKID